jgi:hypothetical protein
VDDEGVEKVLRVFYVDENTRAGVEKQEGREKQQLSSSSSSRRRRSSSSSGGGRGGVAVRRQRSLQDLKPSHSKSPQQCSHNHSRHGSKRDLIPLRASCRRARERALRGEEMAVEARRRGLTGCIDIRGNGLGMTRRTHLLLGW